MATVYEAGQDPSATRPTLPQSKAGALNERGCAAGDHSIDGQISSDLARHRAVTLASPRPSRRDTGSIAMKSNLAARREAEAIGIQTTSSSRSWTVPLRVLAMLLTILMVATPHPFGRGEAILINYVNNSADAEAFTYYNGWVMIYPFAIAYWAH